LGYKRSKNERKRRCLRVKMEVFIEMGIGDDDGVSSGASTISTWTRWGTSLSALLMDFRVWGAILDYKRSKNERKRRCLKVKMEDLVEMGFGDYDGDELGSIYDVDLDSLGDKFECFVNGFSGLEADFAL
jgi:hypothetical protein